MTADPVEVAFLVGKALERAGVDYIVSGGLASSSHGEPRATQDVDVAVHLRVDQLPKLLEELPEGLELDPGSARTAIREHGAFFLLHLPSYIKVDVYVCRQEGFHASAIRRGASAKLSSRPDRSARVASPEDIVVQKLSWYRQGNLASDRQWRDVLGVLKANRGALDSSYMRRWAADQGVSDLLSKALAEAGWPA